MRTKPVRGCNDILPKEMAYRNSIIDIIKKTYSNNGFLMVKTPVLESIENLSTGDNGDNSKLMFKTIKRGAKLKLDTPSLCENDLIEEGLRYDLTVPLARLIANNKDNLIFPFKSIQIDDSFRAERPQEGRDRQFTQCDIDIFGNDSILAEIEIITTTMKTYWNVGIEDVICKISNRKILESIILFSGFKAEYINNICIIVDKLDKIGIEGVKDELSKTYDLNHIDNLCNALSNIQKNGIDSCINFGANIDDVENTKKVIDIVSSNIESVQKIVFDITIVRGQGYYTGMVFEMYCPSSGFRGALGGGGRYDNMYKKFTGQQLSAVGFGLGLVSVILTLEKLGKNTSSNTKKIALAYENENDINYLLKRKNELQSTYDVSLFKMPKNRYEFKRKLLLNGFDFVYNLQTEKLEPLISQ